MTATCFACQLERETPAELPRGELNAGKPICRECDDVMRGRNTLPPLGKGAVTRLLQGEDE